MTAPLARKRLLRLKAIPLSFTVALRAFMPLTEPRVEQVFKAGFIIWELLEKLADVALFHALWISKSPPYVKGIHAL